MIIHFLMGLFNTVIKSEALTLHVQVLQAAVIDYRKAQTLIGRC